MSILCLETQKHYLNVYNKKTAENIKCILTGFMNLFSEQFQNDAFCKKYLL